jgi:hypothetical protein
MEPEGSLLCQQEPATGVPVMSQINAEYIPASYILITMFRCLGLSKASIRLVFFTTVTICNTHHTREATFTKALMTTFLYP